MHSNYRTRYIFAIFDITGEISFESAQDLEEHTVHNAPEGYDNVVINLAGVPRIDSAALSVLMKISRKLAEKKKTLFLMNVNDLIKKVLKITGTYGQFKYILNEETLLKKQMRKELDDFLGDEPD
jgi:anti-anti-sigma factor